MTPDDFEDLYRRDRDPWRYETSAYERDKYAATLAACGPGPFTRGLELGASIGVLSARLAIRCRRLVTIDVAPTAVHVARRRLGDRADVAIVLGTIPDDIPSGRYDLVLASEILYYLSPALLTRTLTRIRDTTVGGARLVAVHWRVDGPERPGTADEVHRRLHEQPWLEATDVRDTDEYRLDVFERRR